MLLRDRGHQHGDIGRRNERHGCHYPAKTLSVLVKRIINRGRRVYVYASHGYDDDDDDDDDALRWRLKEKYE